MTASRRPPGRVQVLLQGRFAVARGQVPVSIPHSSERIVAFLALHDRPLKREAVAATLWTEADGDRAAAALRTALWRLGAARAGRLIRVRGQDLALCDDVEIDMRRSRLHAQAIVAGRSDAVERRDVALLRDAADLLPDWYDDWVIVERERFRDLRVQALERSCRDLSAAGHYADAIESGMAALAAEPLRESVHRVLIATHLAEGNKVDALRQFAMLRDLLRRELDLEPSPELAAALDQ